MDLHVATKDSLERQLQRFEHDFELKSAEFFRLYKLKDAPERIPPHERVVWADTCLRWHRVADARNHRSRGPAPAK